jgi:hypothetical protein
MLAAAEREGDNRWRSTALSMRAEQCIAVGDGDGERPWLRIF